MSNLQTIIDQLTAAALESSNATKLAVTRIRELETCLNRMVLAHENTLSDSEGRWPQPDAGCIDCTVGTVPNRLNTGPCAYHAAKRLLGLP